MAIVMSALLRFTPYDNPFDIFRLFSLHPAMAVAILPISTHLLIALPIGRENVCTLVLL